MRYVRHFGVIGFALLALSLFGCGLGGNETEQTMPTAAPTAVVTVEESVEAPVEEATIEASSEALSKALNGEPASEPAAEGSNEGPPDNEGDELVDATGADGSAPPFDAVPQLGSFAESLEQYDSYHFTFEMRFELGDASAEPTTMTFDTKRTTDPPASITTIEVVDNLMVEDVASQLGARSMVMTEVDGTSYIFAADLGDCMVVTDGENDPIGMEPFAQLTDAQQLLGELSDAEYIGDDSVNGQPVHHYRFDQDDVPNAAMGLEELKGDVYVSTAGNYLVRLVIEGFGNMGTGFQEIEEVGAIRLEYNVLEVGEPYTIEPPEECRDKISNLPIFEGAENVSYMMGMTNYMVDAELAEVVAFYQTEMAAFGYELDGEPAVTDTTAQLSFSAPDKPSVSVSISDEEGEVMVSLWQNSSQVEYPIYEGAENLSDSMGIKHYMVDAVLAEVVAFYQTEMAVLGYELTGEPAVTGTTTELLFSAPDKPSVSVWISGEDGYVSVMIAEKIVE